MQRALRRLGYLASGFDGTFGPATEAAVRALQFDLLENHGEGSDGAAPVSVAAYNRGGVAQVDGVVTAALETCMAAMLDDGDFCKVPSSDRPAERNAGLRAGLGALAKGIVPRPFLEAVLDQESGCRHFNEPVKGDGDNFVLVGLDRSTAGSPRITSRGFGVSQVTLFHHPPTKKEAETLLSDPEENTRHAVRHFREKFDKFVNGATPATRADDRMAEIGAGPLRLCRFDAADSRHLEACRDCLAAAGAAPDTGVPDRARVGCDWPYAVRRYNGSGPRSYDYQAKILRRILNR